MYPEERRRRALLGYALAAVSTIAAIATRGVLWGSAHEGPLLPFVLAVVVTAAYGGARPGIVATVLGAAAATYLAPPPPEGVIAIRAALVLFVVVGAGVSVMGGRLHEALAASRAAAETALQRESALREVTARALATDRIERQNAELEQRVAERTAELESLLVHAPIGFAFFDRRGKCLRVNAELARMNGLALRSHSGKPIKEISPVNAASIEPLLRRVFETGEAVGDIEVAGETPEHPGEQRHWLTGFYPVRTPNGAIASVGAVVMEITERKRAEQEREQLLGSERAARAEAERASRLKDDFVATISHELRTPLNAILGWSQLLRRPTRTPEHLEKGLEIVERNARLLVQLISDLLDVSRISAGKLHLEMEAVDLPAVVEAALEAVRPAAEANGVSLVAHVTPPGAPLLGDPGRIQQVVWNLVSNAIKFTPRGGRVEVALARSGAHARLTVTDTGQGIPPEFLPHVFDRFRQADASAARRHGGLGLGLSIVKHLVEAQGGKVRAESEGVGKGARFTLELPLAVSAGPSAAIAARADAPSLRGVKVLVVEDEPDARELVRRVLDEREAEVLMAASAPEALDALAEHRPDILVSDIGLPGMDGYALIRQIRAGAHGRLRNVPAVALTAFARPEDRERALLAGYEAHLAKPVEPAELVTAVAQLSAMAR